MLPLLMTLAMFFVSRSTRGSTGVRLLLTSEFFFTLDAFRKTYSNVIIPPSVSNLGTMTAGPLPPPEPANHAEESSDEEVDDEEDEDEDEDENENGEENDILPPTVRRQPGRPRKERTEAEKERRRRRRGTVRRIQRCRLCRAVSHSKRTCKGPSN